MLSQIRTYPWQCNECKTCDQCRDPVDEEKMLFCDFCDRGYHIYCVGLRKVPDGRWHCPACARCGSCGAKEPCAGAAAASTGASPAPAAAESNPADRKVQQWVHEVIYFN